MDRRPRLTCPHSSPCGSPNVDTLPSLRWAPRTEPPPAMGMPGVVLLSDSHPETVGSTGRPPGPGCWSAARCCGTGTSSRSSSATDDLHAGLRCHGRGAGWSARRSSFGAPRRSQSHSEQQGPCLSLWIATSRREPFRGLTVTSRLTGIPTDPAAPPSSLLGDAGRRGTRQSDGERKVPPAEEKP
jgi:hypothetical protein